MTVPGFCCGRPRRRSYRISLTIALLALILCGGAAATEEAAEDGGRNLRAAGDGGSSRLPGAAASDGPDPNQPDATADRGMTWIEPEDLPAEVQFERRLNMGCGEFVRLAGACGCKK